MSDAEAVAAQEVAAPVEATSTTEVQPTPEVEVETTQPLSRSMSRRERRNVIAERIKNAARPRAPDGKFVKQEAVDTIEETTEVAADEVATIEEDVPVAADEVATVEADSAAEESVAEESGPSEVTKAPEPQSVTIPLDPSHPLYAQGIKELTDVPAHLERAMRTMANASVRAKEVDQARAAQQAAETELAMTRARMDMLQSGTVPTIETSPEIQTLLADVEQAYPEQVDTVKRAFEALQQQTLQVKEAEVMADVQRNQVGRTFLYEVQDAAAKQYPVWNTSGELSERMRIAVAQYGDYVDARNANLDAVGQAQQMPSSQEFFSWVDTNYVKDKRVQNQLSDFKVKSEAKIGQARAQEAVATERKKLAAEEKQRLTSAAERHGAKPPSPPAMRSQGQVAPPPPAAEEARRNHGTRQRDVRSSIRQRLQQSSV